MSSIELFFSSYFAPGGEKNCSLCASFFFLFSLLHCLLCTLSSLPELSYVISLVSGLVEVFFFTLAIFCILSLPGWSGNLQLEPSAGVMAHDLDTCLRGARDCAQRAEPIQI